MSVSCSPRATLESSLPKGLAICVAGYIIITVVLLVGSLLNARSEIVFQLFAPRIMVSSRANIFISLHLPNIYAQLKY